MASSPSSTQQPSAVSAVRSRRRPWSFDTRIRVLTALLCAPGLVAIALLLPWLHVSVVTQIAVLGLVAFVCLIIAVTLHDRIVRPLQTLSNVVAALREGDFSFRARGARAEDSLGELAREINALADILQAQRLSALEATAFLRRVVEVMDAPILAFDPEQILCLINPAGERIFGLPAAHCLGRTAQELKLTELLSEREDAVITLMLDGQQTKWMIRKTSFRQRGIPHMLILLSDVSLPLREQERQAWQRLVRVLGHELNNSLAPIKSIAGSLRMRLSGTALESRKSADFEHGLSVIESRAESLNRFVQGYRTLAKLPPPIIRTVALRPLIQRVVDLDTRQKVEIIDSPDINVAVDPDQIEHLLINIIRNAIDAALDNTQSARPDPEGTTESPVVRIRWLRVSDAVTIVVSDNGPGLTNPSNLFVPFYTTKSGGTGVGLVLARQIAEMHGGSLELMNLPKQRGCEAWIRIRQ